MHKNFLKDEETFKDHPELLELRKGMADVKMTIREVGLAGSSSIVFFSNTSDNSFRFTRTDAGYLLRGRLKII